MPPPPPPTWPSPHERRLLDLLAAAPIVELAGVTSASGPAGVKSRAQPTWTFKLTLDAWRTGAGPVSTTPLLLRQEVGPKELDRYRNTIQPYQVLRFRARLAADPGDNSPVAQIEQLLGPSDDPDLLTHAKRLQEPIYYRDAALGVFQLDRRVDRFETKRDWNGHPVTLSLGATSPDALERAARVARLLCRDAAAWDRRAREHAAAELLDVHNEGWRESEDGDDETPILTAAQFCARMTPESIGVDPDGSFQIWYADGDLFWGHAIEVCADGSGKFTRADMVG